MKIALIKQPIGIGDVFYLQKFAHVIKSRGYEILWPLRDDVIWIKDYVDGINFCKLSDDFPRKNYYYSGRFFIQTDDFIFLSPDGFQLQGKRIMESKYLMIKESDHDWYNYFNFKRNIDKENDLYYNVLGLTDESQYVFLNNMASVDVKTSNVLDDLSFIISTSAKRKLSFLNVLICALEIPSTNTLTVPSGNFNNCKILPSQPYIKTSVFFGSSISEFF